MSRRGVSSAWGPRGDFRDREVCAAGCAGVVIAMAPMNCLAIHDALTCGTSPAAGRGKAEVLSSETRPEFEVRMS